MSTLLAPDAGALYGSREHQQSIGSAGSKYADVLTLHTDARIALNTGIHHLTSLDSVARPHLEDTLRNGLDQVAAQYVDEPQKIKDTLLPNRHKINIHDAVVERIAPHLPTTAQFHKEVRDILKNVPQNQDASITSQIHRNLISLYAMRVVEQAVLTRDEALSLSETKPDNPNLPIQTNQALHVVEEMKQFGIERVRQFYSFADELLHMQTVPELEAVQKKIEKSPDLDRETKSRLLIVGQEQTAELVRTLREEADGKEPPSSKGEVARGFLDDLRDTYAYIDSLTPEEQKGILSQLPLKTLELFHRTRTLMNLFTDRIATSSELREMFWQLRLGRKVGDFLKNHPLQYAKPADLHRYSEHLYDKLLRSEGAGFEIKGALPPEASGVSPDAAITGCVQTLLESNNLNFPSDASKPVLFTIVVNEFTTFKIHVPPHSSPEKVQEIVAAAKREKVDLSDSERAHLTYSGYKPSKERWKDETYRRMYGHGTDNMLEGDYLVYVSTTTPPNRMNPTSLYHVGPHKAAVGLHIGQDARLGVIFNHAHYDGVPAKKTYKDLADGILLHSKTNTLDSDTRSHPYITLENVLSAEQDHEVYPIPEGVGYATDNFPYQKMVVRSHDGESVTLSPTDVRAIVIGLANNIDYMHHLFAGVLPPGYSKTHPTHNNVQPNVIGFETLRRTLDTHYQDTHAAPPSLKGAIKSLLGKSATSAPKQVEEWAQNFTESSVRCKRGEGPASTMSAVVGTWEGPLGTVAALMHPGTVTLTDADGMFSAIFDPKGNGETLEFTTAQSDSYSPKSSKIDLHSPRASVGVVGYNQEGKNGKAVTTSRKFPGQAQVKLRDAITGWFEEGEKDSYRSYMTLEYMNDLIREWDKLSHGKTSLSTYLEVRGKTFDLLQTTDACGVDRLAANSVDTPQKLQLFLNTTLNQAAQDTVDAEKLYSAYEIFKSAVDQISDRKT